MDTLTQLPLKIQLNDGANFDNFVPGVNQLAWGYLPNFLDNNTDPVCYLWGAVATGKSHLLQAVSYLCTERGIGYCYLPLIELVNYTPEALENLENYPLIIIDDIDVLAGKMEWQEALFHLYNRALQKQHKLLISANCTPQYLPFELADLKSRLSAATIFQLQSLNEAEKITALIKRAQLRGVTLTQPVAEYLINHWPRDFRSLITALEKLDTASLIEQRKLTIPFVKKVMGI
jgi:DnaA family protein